MTMSRLMKILLRWENVLIKNGRPNMTEHPNLSTRSCCTLKMVFPCQVIGTNEYNAQHNRNNLANTLRTFSSSSTYKWNQRMKIVSKTAAFIESRNRNKKKNSEDRVGRHLDADVLEDKQTPLKNTRRKIKEKGKLLMKDIKETKNKMKEKFEEVIEKENVYTIPNLLCITRIGLSPVLGYLIVSHKFEYALAFMVAAGVSDWVDGWIARNYKSQSSKIGSFLDPMADKVLIGTLFLTLTYVDLIPGYLTALIIGKDAALIISGFVIRYLSLPPPRTISRYFDVTYATAQLAPTFISKVNTGIQLVLAATTLASSAVGYINHPVHHVLWCVTAASTVVAAGSYLTSKETYKFLREREKLKKKKN